MKEFLRLVSLLMFGVFGHQSSAESQWLPVVQSQVWLAEGVESLSLEQARSFVGPMWTGGARDPDGGWWPVALQIERVTSKDQLTGKLIILFPKGKKTYRVKGAVRMAGDTINLAIVMPRKAAGSVGGRWDLKHKFGTKKLIGTSEVGGIELKTK